MNAENKKITLEDLAQEMRSGFVMVDSKIKESEKRIIENVDTKIEDLAMMTKHGFDEVDGRLDKMDGRLDKMDGRLDKMDGRLIDMNERLVDLDKTNTLAHEDAGLRLNNMAYRFELTDLKKRVEFLEKKAVMRV